MPGPQKKKKKKPPSTHSQKFGTKRRTRDIDQVHEDLQDTSKFDNPKFDEDLPGEGQFYCICCARHFETDKALQSHFKTSIHKRRLKKAKEDPYTQQEADECGKF